jgi:hypothetical protein
MSGPPQAPHSSGTSSSGRSAGANHFVRQRLQMKRRSGTRSSIDDSTPEAIRNCPHDDVPPGGRTTDPHRGVALRS